MNARKIAVIGPVFPFRGGIAQHTSRLCEVLQDGHDILVLSFARQYPKFLYPGEEDRDPASPALNVKDVRFVIDSMNPISWVRAGRMLKQFKPDLVIIPWWTFFLAPCLGWLARTSRSAAAHVRFVCHNTVDHEESLWKKLIANWVLRAGHSYLVHSNVDREHLKERLGACDIRIHAHPIYDQFPDAAQDLPKRAALELLFFGLVRPYKGLDILIEALGRLERDDWHLSIVGEFWSGQASILARISELGLESQIEIVPRYVSDQEAADYFTRADLVVLPYRSATGSGVIPVAYNYNKPVLVTNVGGLPDVVQQGRTGILVEPDDPAALATALEGITAAWLADTAGAIEIFKKALSWESFARTLCATETGPQRTGGQT